MIVNETLPVIADPVLGGGVQSVVVSTVLIVIFAEVIPQSVCTRYGLAVGAKMAPFVKVLLCTIGILAWPVAKLLEVVLGPHHGIIYRRGELKELIQIHEDTATNGGDLKHDTVTIIGATLDLQEKVVKHAMTPIDSVFMLSIDAILDYNTLRQICQTGHSRIPVYEEFDMPFGGADPVNIRVERVKKIVGILLVKQCVLLDPSDAVPVRKIPLNKVTLVPQHEPLLGILDRFQEGRSHMAIVTRVSQEKAASVKHVVKTGLTQQIKNRVGMGDSSCSSSESSSDEEDTKVERKEEKKAKARGKKGRKGSKETDLEPAPEEHHKSRTGNFQLPKVTGRGFEQSMPADAVLAKEDAEDFLQSLDPAVAPLGIITLEDVLEELIGEEIYDEFDPETEHEFSSYVPELEPSNVVTASTSRPLPRRAGSTEKPAVDSQKVAPPLHERPASKSASGTPLLRPIAVPALPALPGLKSLSLFNSSASRSKSAPPTPRTKKLDLSPTDGAHADAEPPASAIETTAPGEVSPTTPKPAIRFEEPVTPSDAGADGSRHSEPATVTFVDFAHPATPAPVAQPVPAIPAMLVASLSAPVSRQASPAPSLEAALLTTRRGRQQRSAVAGTSGGAHEERAGTPGPKGTSFKSKPLRVPVGGQVPRDLRSAETKSSQQDDERTVAGDE